MLLFEPLRDGTLLFDGQDFFLLLSQRTKELLGDTVFFDTLSLRDGGLRLSEEIVDCFSVLVFKLELVFLLLLRLVGRLLSL